MSGKRILGAVIAAALLSIRAYAATDVMFFVDAEDYTGEYSTDALRDLAKVFNAESVKVQVNVVGYLARQLRQQGRNDVFRELRPHLVGSRTLYLAKHPTVAEYTDIADARQAYRLAVAEESLSLGLIKSAFGIRSVPLYAPVGADSYAAMYAAADAGMKYCVGAAFAASDAVDSGFWYCGLYHLPILDAKVFQLSDLMGSAEPDYPAILNRLAARKFVGLRVETSWVANQQTWLELNFNPRHPVAFGEWKKNQRRPVREVRRFYDRVRRLLVAMKDDSRFRLVSLNDYADLVAERRTVRRTDVSVIRSLLQEKFGPLDEYDLSLADIYQAAVDFLRGSESFKPGQVRGFLEMPQGVRTRTEISSASLRDIANRLSDVDYIPSHLEVETVSNSAVAGKVRIGPADFVLAALEALETGAPSVTVVPRDQLGASPLPPSPPTVRADKFLSDRLRLQNWTFRNSRR